MKYLILLALGLLSFTAFAANDSGKVNVSGLQNVSNYTALFESTCTSNESSDVGALPGDFMYGFKRFFENVDEWFTFDKGNLAKKHAQYGHLRAVEAHLETCKAKAQSDDGNATQANQTMNIVNGLVNETNRENDEADKDLEDGLKDGSADNSTVSNVTNTTRNSITVLQRVYEKAPEEAKEGLLHALNNSIQNFEKHQEKMAEQEGKRSGKNETNETENETKGHGGNETENETENDTGKGSGHENETNSSVSGHGKPSGAGDKGSHGGENETD